MIWLYILIFIISCLALVRSGAWVTRSLTGIAQFLGWREFILASVLMAFFTSLPELFIGVTAAFAQKPQLALGVIIGSNIITLTFIIGVGTLLAGELKFESKTLQKSSFYAGIYGLLPLLLMFDGYLSRADGVILLLALAFYFFQLFSHEERFSRIFANHLKDGWVSLRKFLKDLAVFGGGITLLLLSAQGIVFSASKIALSFNLSLVIIGAIFVAIGTSIPEIVFEIKAISMGHKKMILGNAMGSVVINSTLILGLMALISPFQVSNFSPYLIGFIFIIITSFFFVIFSQTDRKITSREAIFLIGIYFSFVVFELLLG